MTFTYEVWINGDDANPHWEGESEDEAFTIAKDMLRQGNANVTVATMNDGLVEGLQIVI